MYQLSIVAKADHIHACVTGKESLENSRAYWREIAAVCKEHGLKRVLVEDYLEGEISTLDIHAFAKTFVQETGIPLGTRIASVSLPEKLPDQQFAETVALNWAGVKVRVFTEVDKAGEWLLGQQ